MLGRTTKPLARRALLIDDELTSPASAGGRAVRALADELSARGVEVVEALSCEDGLANVTSDAALHAVLLNWTLGGDGDGGRSHAQATELLRALRRRDARVPIFLLADRKVAGTITVEVATLADEFVWTLAD